MPIRVLPDHVVSKIAAGEVVERPASVVKELIENAIDAGAGAIEVEARNGGKSFIRVVDDGCGVPRGEVELAFHRHATSKLTTAEDLERITTLGFRGEALASIAAVSRMTFVTRAQDEAVGTHLRLENGEILACREVGRPSGTAVTVENLFFNVPARRKFLRTDRTERRHIERSRGATVAGEWAAAGRAGRRVRARRGRKGTGDCSPRSALWRHPRVRFG